MIWQGVTEASHGKMRGVQAPEQIKIEETGPQTPEANF